MRVGILGTGHMGNTHARQYNKMRDVTVGFHDRHQERGLSFRDKWNAECCQSSDELIAWADIIDICLPTDLHVEYALRAIAAGKAVFIEKPIARTLKDGMRIIDAAERANMPLMAGQVVRFFPEFAAGHRMVKSGAVGTPAAARTRRGGGAPKGHNEWFMDHERSGGVLLDLAIHDFDWLRWTLGEVQTLYARSVAAESGSGKDYGSTTLKFESGAVAHVESTWMDPGGFRATFEVAGSGGLIQYDSRQSPSLRTHTAGGARLDSTMSPLDDPYYLELRAFVEAVRSGSMPPVPGYEGLMALSIALAAVESARTGQPVTPVRP